MVRQPAKRFLGKRSIAVSVCTMIVLSIVCMVVLRRQNRPTNAAAEAVSVSRPIGPSTVRPVVVQEPVEGQGPVDLKRAAHPLDPVLELARRALVQMQDKVDDYTGRMIKRERIKGVLGGEVQMEFKIRASREEDGERIRALSVYLKFLEPKSARGREVIWAEGTNSNKLTGHEGGFLNLLRVELEPTGMLAMMDNKYPITDIGLTKLVEKLIEKGERDRQLGPCEVQIVEDQRVGDRVCRLVQVTHPQPDPQFDFHIAQIFIDTERLIPLRYAAFMWPKESGGEPLLEEEYTYLDVKLNVGLTDADFDPNNPSYNYP